MERSFFNYHDTPKSIISFILYKHLPFFSILFITMNDIFDFNFDRSGNNIGAPKMRHSFVLSNYPLFQYCDSNIRFFYNKSFCLIFYIKSFFSFFLRIFTIVYEEIFFEKKHQRIITIWEEIDKVNIWFRTNNYFEFWVHQ